MSARGPVPVEVRVATAPDGEINVLLQLPDGYVLMHPDAAEIVAANIVDMAAEAVRQRTAATLDRMYE